MDEITAQDKIELFDSSFAKNSLYTFRTGLPTKWHSHNNSQARTCDVAARKHPRVSIPMSILRLPIWGAGEHMGQLPFLVHRL